MSNIPTTTSFYLFINSLYHLLWERRDVVLSALIFITRACATTFDCVVADVAFPILAVLNSPNLDSLYNSLSWGLVNLIRATNVLRGDSRTSSMDSLNWTQRLLVEQELVEV